MAECPAGYTECEGICHFRIGDQCFWSSPPKPIRKFFTEEQRFADLEARISKLESDSKALPRKVNKAKFTGGINVQ